MLTTWMTEQMSEGNEIERLVAMPIRGVSPRFPIRKRAYYRALKRKEPWVIMERSTRKILADMNKTLYEKYEPGLLEIIGLEKILK